MSLVQCVAATTFLLGRNISARRSKALKQLPTITHHRCCCSLLPSTSVTRQQQITNNDDQIRAARAKTSAAAITANIAAEGYESDEEVYATAKALAGEGGDGDTEAEIAAKVGPC